MTAWILAVALALGADDASLADPRADGVVRADAPLGSLLGAQDVSSAPSESLTSGGVIYRLLGWATALAVLGAAGVGIWKRATIESRTSVGGRGVRVVSRTALGPRQQLCLVRVGNERMLLLGVAGDRISALTEFTDPLQILALDGSFAEALKGAGAPAQASMHKPAPDEPEGVLVPFRRELQRLRGVVSGWRDRLQKRDPVDRPAAVGGGEAPGGVSWARRSIGEQDTAAMN